MARYTLLACMALLLASCAGYHAQAPQGFAAYGKGDNFRAVSPDGVVYQVSDSKHKPKADLAFWKEALTKRMHDAGYHAVDSMALTVDGVSAYGILLEAPLGSTDQSYLVVAIPTKKRMVVVEAAGDTPKFAARKAAILEAVQKLNVKN